MDASLRRALLKLQHLEMTLLRAHLAQPGYLMDSELQRLRYLIGFARLYRFEPGAALSAPSGREIEVHQPLVESVRSQVLHQLGPLLRGKRSHKDVLTASVKACRRMRPVLVNARREVLAYHAAEFDAVALDVEVGRKSLVISAGGGGGAGYVYIGAMVRLRALGLWPDYLVGASIGSLIGAFLARERFADLDAILDWAKALRAADMFSLPSLGPTHTLPGLTRLHLRDMHRMMTHADGAPLRLGDLAVPYDAVIAGVHQRAYRHLPRALRQFVSTRGTGDGRRLGRRMLMALAFLNPQVTHPIVLGRDPQTRWMRATDAVGLSAAIPGVLQYEPPRRDPDTTDILESLRSEHRVALFADGGVTANVPARIAWEGVQDGRIGTRNVFHLALDCFRPQYDPRHLWLWPVTQAVALQLPLQRKYYDALVRFGPTLSPINLLPSARDFDRACRWGERQIEPIVPLLQLALTPVEWPDQWDTR
ncbi:patatin-like phospholipase family protein [Algiphilus sp.]|uniref:patatin-like phospholipase family protein n=1 Tax=Algiphilus sp. TaxID=1872431 RepID=UPI0032EFF92F